MKNKITLTKAQKQSCARYRRKLKKIPQRCIIHNRKLVRVVWGAYRGGADLLTSVNLENNIYRSLHSCKLKNSSCYWEITSIACGKIDNLLTKIMNNARIKAKTINWGNTVTVSK